jgi:outer membrane immunogenic protein
MVIFDVSEDRREKVRKRHRPRCVDWNRGRAGWLATPNLLLFGTGGFAYGRVAESANYALNGSSSQFPNFSASSGFSFICAASGAPCFTGASSATRTGWTAGGGLEWLFAPHWSAKIEYQFIDLGSETLRITGMPCAAACGFATAPSSFNVAFHDRFNVVRLSLNYHF